MLSSSFSQHHLYEIFKVIVDDLMQSSILKFYRCYADDTNVLIKPADTHFVLKQVNSFAKNLRFTAFFFKNGWVHFLDLHRNQAFGHWCFSNPTRTGQCSHCDSFAPMETQNGLNQITLFVLFRICTNSAFLNKQITQICKFMTWNGFKAGIRL